MFAFQQSVTYLLLNTNQHGTIIYRVQAGNAMPAIVSQDLYKKANNN
jgi:hypothetical protein